MHPRAAARPRHYRGAAAYAVAVLLGVSACRWGFSRSEPSETGDGGGAGAPGTATASGAASAPEGGAPADAGAASGGSTVAGASAGGNGTAGTSLAGAAGAVGSAGAGGEGDSPGPGSVTLGPESELTPIGTALGTAFSDSCPPDQVLVGFEVYSQSSAASLVYAVTGTCAALMVSGPGAVMLMPTGDLPLRGDPTFASASSQTCPPGQVIVGFDGRSRTAVDQLAFTCAPLTLESGSILIGAPTTLPPTGGTGGVAVSRACSDGQVARGRSGYSDTVLERFSLLCASVSVLP